MPTTTDRTAVAFLGLGRMGRAMARNVATGPFDLTVWNRTSSVADELADEVGATAARSPGEAAAGADIVVTMLADGDALVEVYERADGVLSSLRPGAVAVDMGTSGPLAVTRVRTGVEAVGASMVDAPVSGSTPAAEAASLLIMVGAPEELFARVAPALEAMGKPVPVGPPGAGAALKLVVNSILYAINQALAEGIALADAAGVSPETVIDIVAQGAAGAPIVTYRKPQYLDPYGAPVMFSLDLSAKDLDLTLEQAAAAGIRMPQAERTRELIRAAIEAGHGSRDMGFVVEAMRLGLTGD